MGVTLLQSGFETHIADRSCPVSVDYPVVIACTMKGTARLSCAHVARTHFTLPVTWEHYAFELDEVHQGSGRGCGRYLIMDLARGFTPLVRPQPAGGRQRTPRTLCLQ